MRDLLLSKSSVSYAIYLMVYMQFALFIRLNAEVHSSTKRLKTMNMEYNSNAKVDESKICFLLLKGWQINPYDLSTRHASIMVAIASTFGSLGAIAAPLVTGELTINQVMSVYVCIEF